MQTEKMRSHAEEMDRLQDQIKAIDDPERRMKLQAKFDRLKDEDDEEKHAQMMDELSDELEA